MARIHVEYIGGGQYAVVDSDGASQNIGPDYGFPSVAESFGMRLRHKPKCADRGMTDGSIDCPSCGQDSYTFIMQAIAYLRSCADSSRTIADPGYFE